MLSPRASLRPPAGYCATICGVVGAPLSVKSTKPKIEGVAVGVTVGKAIAVAVTGTGVGLGGRSVGVVVGRVHAETTKMSVRMKGKILIFMSVLVYPSPFGAESLGHLY